MGPVSYGVRPKSSNTRQLARCCGGRAAWVCLVFAPSCPCSVLLLLLLLRVGLACSASMLANLMGLVMIRSRYNRKIAK